MSVIAQKTKDKAPGATGNKAGQSPAVLTARRVLAAEADALLAAADGLDEQFTEVVDRIARIKGRVIVTGMGKSGHIGRKIAATFSSTGTPALFVHPAEASHGDLGMITHADLVLALSNSGETPELADLIAYAKRFALPLVAIVGRPSSSLGAAADLILSLPDHPEACPMGLAPTTSTTTTLALADALAIALLEKKGFNSDGFGIFHPGGKLGKRLIQVEQLMHQRDALPLVTTEATTAEAILEMTAKRFGCVGIVDGESKLVGIVTDGDLRRHMGHDLLSRPALHIMTPEPKTIRRRALAVEALGVMNQPDRQITVIFVVEDNKPIGILHMHDCLRAGVA
ncbi:MAG: KpsF/GutQ family sugar-phosphate isomerase [Geminicoccales bacterium]